MPNPRTFSSLMWGRCLPIGLTLIGSFAVAEDLHFPSIPPVPPNEAEKTFETLHGFHMDLLAAEPLVTDPVAIAYDEDGRAYVAEMNDYPYTDKAHHKASQENPTDQPIGKIRMLIDDDGDGKFDRSTVFAEGLSWPTGIACWKGGIIVTATPDVWYFKDTDGDGKADVRQKLMTGFKKLNVQAVMNNPIWGLDNHLYLAGGTNGGEVQDLAVAGSKPVVMRRSDLRLDPRTMAIEAVSGGARFGNSRDDWGNRFLCNIRNPAQHIVLESRYLARNPYLPSTVTLNDSAESGDQIPVHRASPPEAWREYRAKRWAADSTVASHMPRSELVGSGVVTSSSGVTVYRGDAYPPEFHGNIFVADVAGNLFYRLALEADGPSFKAKRVDGDHEMCAGRDVWFRPVNFANAPDGCLHVCDMYREVIEHPWSLPDDIHAALDLERGRDKGRLYRLAPPGFKPRATPHLSKASTAELVALLGHPNAWHRDTAQRLLFERQDQSAVPSLRDALAKGGTPVARLHALWTLDGLGGLTENDLIGALHDADSHVRASAVLLAEPKLKTSPKVEGAVAKLASDDAANVRFQVALSLGENPGDSTSAALNAIAKRDVGDSWMRTAVLSSCGASSAGLIAAVLQVADSDDAAAFVRDAGAVVGGYAKPADCTFALAALAANASSHPLASEGGLLGLAKGLSRHGKTPQDFATGAEAKRWLTSLAEKTRTTLSGERTGSDDALRFIPLLALADFATAQSLAEPLLAPKRPDAVRVAFIRQLQERRENGVADLILNAWPTLTPAVREAAAAALASRKEWVEALLAAVEQQRVKPAELSVTARAALQRVAVVGLRERAAKLFASVGSRQEVLQRYQPVLSKQGDLAKGQAVYSAVCAACHRKGDAGKDVGPNLATVSSWSAEQLLTNILDPNREVSPNFMLYTVDLKDGRALAGIVVGETDAGLTLKRLDGVEETIPRGEVTSLKATGTSPMPEGLEATITVDQMADLIAFLRSGS